MTGFRVVMKSMIASLILVLLATGYSRSYRASFVVTAPSAVSMVDRFSYDFPVYAHRITMTPAWERFVVPRLAGTPEARIKIRNGVSVATTRSRFKNGLERCEIEVLLTEGGEAAFEAICQAYLEFVNQRFEETEARMLDDIATLRAGLARNQDPRARALVMQRLNEMSVLAQGFAETKRATLVEIKKARPGRGLAACFRSSD